VEQQQQQQQQRVQVEQSVQQVQLVQQGHCLCHRQLTQLVQVTQLLLIRWL
jgi:hypothetical protein